MSSTVRWAKLGLLLLVGGSFSHVSATPSTTTRLSLTKVEQAMPREDAKFTAASIDAMQVASLDGSLLLPQPQSRHFVSFVDALAATPPSTEETFSNLESRLGFHLPEPGHGSVFLSTIALAVFFFIRRLTR